MGRLAGKKALITGAAGGIGSATARAFVAAGADVYLTDLNATSIFELVNELKDAPGSGKVAGSALDITDPADWDRAVAAACDLFGGLNTLVNIAGVMAWPGVEETDLELWNKIVTINQTGPWLGMKAAMPALLESGNASIINTSSILGLIGSGAGTAYQGAKGAVRLISKTAAVEYGARGVRVNSLHPGVIATPMTKEILDAEGEDNVDIQRTPMKRPGRPEEIAAGFVFLASDDSSFMTGSELVIDGGITAH